MLTWVLSCFSHLWLFATIARKTLLPMGFSKWQYWSGSFALLQGSSWPENQTLISYISCIGRQILFCCCCSLAQLFLTVCNPTDCSMPNLPILHYLPEFAQTRVHWVGDIIQPSHPFLPPSTPVLSISWREQQTTPVFLPWEPYEQYEKAKSRQRCQN